MDNYVLKTQGYSIFLRFVSACEILTLLCSNILSHPPSENSTIIIMNIVYNSTAQLDSQLTKYVHTK